MEKEKMQHNENMKEKTENSSKDMKDVIIQEKGEVCECICSEPEKDLIEEKDEVYKNEMKKDNKCDNESNNCHESGTTTETRKYNRIEHLKSLINDIRKILCNQEKNRCKTCPCSNELSYKSLEDIFKGYALITFCLLNHSITTKFIPELFLKSFILEINLLEYLRIQPLKIPDVLFSHQCNDKADIKKYIAAYKTYMNDTKVHINCEQDIESLTYKYYKTYCVRNRNTYYDDLLLFLLLRRNESERFFAVFKKTEKNIFGYRLALLLSLFNECCRESADIFKEIKKCRNIPGEGILKDLKEKYSSTLKDIKDSEIEMEDECYMALIEKKYFSTEDQVSFKSNSSLSIFSDITFLKKVLDDESMFNKFESVFDETIRNFEINIKENKEAVSIKNEDEVTTILNSLTNDSLVILIRIVFYSFNLMGFDKEMNSWFQEKKIKMDWENSVRNWAISREGDKVGLDHAMINHCTRYAKYEDGYLIYSMQEQKNEYCLLKTAVLCLTAFRETSEKIWIERICDLIQICANGKMKSVCCAMADSLLNKLVFVNEEGRELLLVNLIEAIERFHLEEDEQMINILLKGFFSLCTECKNTKTCDLCYKYALKVYKKWRESQEGFFFFRKKSKLGDNIYSYILGVCDEHNDCDSFHKVCKDILKSNEKIGDCVLGRLEKYHRKCECHVYDCENGEKYNRCLLKHCMCEFKK